MEKIGRILIATLITILILSACQNDQGTQNSEDVEASNNPSGSAELPEGGNVEAVDEVPEETQRIAVLNFQNNPFWLPVKDGAMAAKEYLKNYNTEVDYIDVGDELTSENIVSSMETAIVKQYDAIAVPPVFDGTEAIINKAVSQGIPVMTFVAEGSKPSERISFMGQDAYAAGELAGENIEEYTGGKGKIGVITGVFGATQHEQRMNGALDYLKENAPDIEVVGTYENNDKAEKAYSLTQDMLTAHPDLKLIYVTAGGPFGAAKAISDLNLTGEVGIVAYDHIPDNIKYVRSGEIIAAIAQDPFGQGFDPAVILHNYLINGEEPDDYIPVKLDVLTPDNVDELFPE